jgi:predicted negative regulator of RcsB-dependent stress response|tara:strand:+ start:393 stop:1070 length:678 start_codon:yes stop_codon:yes gene_type:complete
MEIYQTEEQQEEAIKNYLKDNGNTIIAGLVLGLGGFVGFNYYQDNKLGQELALADSYQILVESSADDSNAFIEQGQAFVADNNKSSYASLTALALAKESAKYEDWSQVEKELLTAIENAPNEGIKAIATLRLARVQVQQEAYTEALTTLEQPIATSFVDQVEEIKGDAYLLQGKKDQARAAYQKAIAANGLDANPSLQMKLDDLAQAVVLNTAADALKESAAESE